MPTAGPTARDLEGVERRTVWILGSPRSGSTWLMRLLNHWDEVRTIDEPLIGVHLAPVPPGLLGLGGGKLEPGDVLYTALKPHDPNYFFSHRYQHAWRPLMRQLVLGRLEAQVADAARSGAPGEKAVVVKEPNGSEAADLIMSLLPAARLLFLLRDGRDVVDSELDAMSEGSSLRRAFNVDLGELDRLTLIEFLSKLWLLRTNVVERAYRQHAPTLRHMLRYEDLLVEPEAELARVLAWLGLRSSQAAIRQAVDRFSFRSIPEERRGTGEFFRAATPGLWRDNLTPREQEVMHAVMGERLAELGYD